MGRRRFPSTGSCTCWIRRRPCCGGRDNERLLDLVSFKRVSFRLLSGVARLVTRGSVAKTPHFLETISYLAPIPGESSGSGRGLGLTVCADLAVLSLRQGGSLGPYWDGAPDSSSGLIMGDFLSGRISGHEGRGAGKTDPPGGSHIS